MSVDHSIYRSAALAVLAGVGGCGDDMVEIPHREFVGHYTPSLPNQSQTGVVHFEIQADFTVLYSVEGACGEYMSETTYAWEAVDDDTILITNANGGWIDGTYKIRATRGDSCDRLTLEHFTDNFSLYTYDIYRGKLCLSPAGQQCVTTWCEGAPESCS
jgi:hypothetical protein